MTNNKYRKLVIGDIHGGLQALIQVLERANVTKNDTLIFLGDYVDGWSESPQLIDFLINLNKTQKCIFLRSYDAIFNSNNRIFCKRHLKISI